MTLTIFPYYFVLTSQIKHVMLERKLLTELSSPYVVRCVTRHSHDDDDAMAMTVVMLVMLVNVMMMVMMMVLMMVLIKLMMMVLVVVVLMMMLMMLIMLIMMMLLVLVCTLELLTSVATTEHDTDYYEIIRPVLSFHDIAAL